MDFPEKKTQISDLFSVGSLREAYFCMFTLGQHVQNLHLCG
jgi:hypothetical protein